LVANILVFLFHITELEKDTEELLQV